MSVDNTAHFVDLRTRTFSRVRGSRAHRAQDLCYWTSHLHFLRAMSHSQSLFDPLPDPLHPAPRTPSLLFSSHGDSLRGPQPRALFGRFAEPPPAQVMSPTISLRRTIQRLRRLSSKEALLVVCFEKTFLPRSSYWRLMMHNL